MLDALLMCAGCHGMSGEGRPEAGYPRLAAQPAAYLERQLEAYADGRRKSAVMEPLARSLSEAERRWLAQAFSARTPVEMATERSHSKRGETLAQVGDAALRVQACQNCHGPLGRGQAPYGASLAAQPAAYLRAELAAWRSGTRSTDPSGQMAAIARALGEADAQAVASYYAGLPTPSAPGGAQSPVFARTQPPTRAGVGAKPSDGKDAEGTAATSGGTQGPAGGETRR